MAFWPVEPAVGSDRDCSLRLSGVCISVFRHALCPAALLKHTQTKSHDIYSVSLHLIHQTHDR